MNVVYANLISYLLAFKKICKLKLFVSVKPDDDFMKIEIAIPR